jgi:hypothetical protein
MRQLERIFHLSQNETSLLGCGHKILLWYRSPSPPDLQIPANV